jgi:hypothetical protein
MIVNNELERMWKKTAVANLEYYPRICLAEPTKTSGQWVSRLRFEPGISRIQVRNATVSYNFLGTMRLGKTMGICWAGHTARNVEKRKVYRILVEHMKGSGVFGRPSHTCEDNIKIDLEKV